MANAGPSRSIRTRRLLAGSALLTVVVCLVAVLGLSGGGVADQDSGGGSGANSSDQARSDRTAGPRSDAPPAATGSYRGPVPILMYHVIKAPTAGVAYPELWTPPATFRDTVALLRSDGYRGVTIAQVWKAWHGGPGLPAKPVVVSFDDGYLSHVMTARPVLRSAGWPGVLNLEGKNIGKGGLTVPQVKSLIHSGWEIGAHSMTHPDLPTVSDSQLTEEIAGSRSLLQRLFKVPVETFCYPAGKNDSRVQAAVREAGFSNATTVEPGIASSRDNPFALPRIRVNGTDSPRAVLARVRSGAGVAGAYG